MFVPALLRSIPPTPDLVPPPPSSSVPILTIVVPCSFAHLCPELCQLIPELLQSGAILRTSHEPLLQVLVHVGLNLLPHAPSLSPSTIKVCLHCRQSCCHTRVHDCHQDVVFLRGWVGVWSGMDGVGRGGAGAPQCSFWDLDTPQRNPEKILNPQTPSSTRNPEEHMKWEPPI